MFSFRRWLSSSIVSKQTDSQARDTRRLRKLRFSSKKDFRYQLSLDVLEDRTVPATLYVDATPTLGPNPNDDMFTPTQGTHTTMGGLQQGTNLFTNISDALAVANPGDNVFVADGTYNEDIAIVDDNVHVIGTGANYTFIVGQTGGDGATVRVSASNDEIAGFTITREGNTAADWNDPNLNSAGIAIQGTTFTGLLVRDNIITGNRTGIDINNSSGHTVRNNIITDNHTGMIFRNQTDNITVTENDITDNRTVGIVFLDASGGTNSPPQQALNGTFTNNNISANWYAQIVDRQSGGALATPGTTNLKNFSANWFGTATPVVTTANSAEPGYGSLIPVEFGGNATAPGGQPDIAGPASANFDITPLLVVGTDTNIETTPGRGTFGFQGSFSTLNVIANGSQTGGIGRITEGVQLTTVNGMVNVGAGTFNEQLTIDKEGVKVVGQGMNATTINYAGAFSGQGGVYITANRVELRNLTVDGGAFPNTDADPRYGIKIDFANGTSFGVDSAVIDTVKVTHSFRTGLDLNGVTNITVNNLFAIDNGGAGIFMTDVNGASLSNITTSGNPWAGVSIATFGQYFPIGTSGIVFSGNNSFGESGTPNGLGQRNGGLQFEMGNFANPSSPRLISWSTVASDNADVTILSNDFGYALSGASDNSNRYIRFYQTLQQSKDAALGLVDHLVAGTRYIQKADDSNFLPSSTSTQFYIFPSNTPPNTMSIQAAIDAAITGDVINVANGTYAESVLINKNLTVKTDNPTTTLGNLTMSASGATIVPGDGPARLNVTNFSAGFRSNTVLELNGTTPGSGYDQITANGTVTINSAANLTLSLDSSFTPAANTTFTLINKTSVGAISGVFANLANGSTTVIRGVTFRANYAGGDGNDLTLTAISNPTPVNQAPVNQVPGTQTLSTSNSLLFSTGNGNAIQISDVDAGNGNVTVNLQVTSGTLTFSANYGVSVSGYNSSNMTITGNLTNLNKTLNTLYFQPAGAGNVTLTVTSNDNGNTGGPPMTDVDSVTLIVQAAGSHVNSAPTVTAPTTNQNVTPLVPYAFSDANGNGISVGDVDSGFNNVQVTLTANYGRINLGATVGLTFVGGTTNNSSTIIVQGRVDYLNFDLQQLTYTANGNFPGADTLSITINDLGNTGTGGAKSATKNVPLVGTPLPPNVGPTNTVPAGTQVVSPSGEILFSQANGNAIQIADPDSGNGNVTVNLRVNRGTLLFAIDYGVTWSGYSTNNLTITGSLANVNKTLNTLFYDAPSTGGADTLTITTSDNGNSGSGGALTDTDTVAINVATHSNIAPTLTLPPSQNVATGGSVAFNDANGNAIFVGDRDSGYGDVKVTLTVSNGTLSLAGFIGTSKSGDGTNTMVLIGRIDHLNYSLQRLVYTNTTGGADTLQIAIDDQGQNGTGGPKTANGSVAIL